MNLPTALNQTGSRLSSLAGNRRCDAQPVRILMVDDDVSLCRAMQVILAEGRIPADYRTYGGQRLAVCRGGSICDCSVGCSPARWRRQRCFFRVSCFFRLAGHHDDRKRRQRTREACLGGGAVGYLTKPLSISKLLTMIRLFT
jgi:hypothetical protein